MRTGLSDSKGSSCMARLLQRLRNLASEEGSTLMEFAVTLPVFITIITGTTSFAVGVYNLQQLSNATTNAVQAAAAGQGIASDPCSAAQTQVTAYLPNWTASSFSYSMSIVDSNGTSHTYNSTGTTFSCTAGASTMAQNEPIVLTVTYTYKWLPILAFSPSSPLKSTQAAVGD